MIAAVVPMIDTRMPPSGRLRICLKMPFCPVTAWSVPQCRRPTSYGQTCCQDQSGKQLGEFDYGLKSKRTKPL